MFSRHRCFLSWMGLLGGSAMVLYASGLGEQRLGWVHAEHQDLPGLNPEQG